MSTSVTITGSGTPIPDAHRAGPGALVRYDDLTLQFDIGRGTVQRLTGADVWIPDLDAAFVTHHHSDHLTGLADLVLTYWTMDRTDARPPLPIVAPTGPSARYVRTLLSGWHDDIEVRAIHAGRKTRPAVDLIEFAVPDRPVEVWRHGDVVVSAGQVRHEPCPSSVGYRVDTPDGSVAITGDTRVCDEVAQLAAGVDVLVYEAMRFSFFEELPHGRHYVKDYHADTHLIGEQAAAMGVPTLVLTHLIPAPVTDSERQLFVDEVRGGGYEGELIVADDLDTVAVGDGGHDIGYAEGPVC
ncbi:MAG: MBL fold metallo-hydrolase [Acidimicrobiales bacterium]|nr:MBL fold metallo-hydrolase [Acidimicrobiales bacterium]